MAINYYFISVIGGYQWLLIPNLFVTIIFLMVILLIIIGGYFINGH